MKTIFRSTSVALLLAAIIALGAVAGFGQDPCADADGQTAANNNIQELFKDKSIAGRKKTIDAGKGFLEKYGACESAKDLVTYLNTNIPKWEATVKKMEVDGARTALITKFDTGLKNKNWDDVYAAGGELLNASPDDYRAIELVLGSIGLDETAKSPRVTKWNDNTIRYAKTAIADLEGGKTFKTFGFGAFTYKSKDDALAWLNYTIGYILTFDKKNKKEAVGYLYKASQAAASDTSKNPNVYEGIGSFYFDDARKLIAEVDGLAKEVKALEAEVKTITDPELKKQKVETANAKIEAFKAREGMLYGTVERALDAYSRAFKLAPDTAVGKAYRDDLRKTLSELYDVRGLKKDGLDAWINAAVAKPLPNPASPITPIIEAEPDASATAPATAPASAPKPAVPGAKPGAAPGKPGSK